MRRFWLLTAVLVALLTLGTACMGDDEEGDVDVEDEAVVADVPPTPTPITAESVLSSASEEWSETESAHFDLAIDGEVFLDADESLRLLSAEGDVARPASVEADARIEVMGQALDVSLISVDGQAYWTNIITGQWEQAPEDFDYDPSVLFSDTDGIGPILENLQNPELTGTENVNGVETRSVTGTVSAEAVEEITAGAIEGDDVDVTVWIGAEDAKMYRVTLVEPSGIRETPATWTLLLSNHNADVEIEAPEV